MNNRRLLYFFCVLLSQLLGCGSATPSQGARELPVQEFNAQVSAAHTDTEETWTNSALQVALRFIGDHERIAHRSIEIHARPERFDTVTVVVTEEGLLDDSVDGHRYRLSLRRTPEGHWGIESAQKSRKCKPGRGHQSYSNEPCN